MTVMKQKVFRKFRSTAFKRRLLVYCSLLCFCLLFIYGLSSKFACLDIVLDYRISQECSKYYRNEITGNLCPELCAGSSLELSCIHDGEPGRVLGLKNGRKIVLNRAKHDESYEVLTWMDRSGQSHYPTAGEFENLVRRLILFNFNISSLPHNQLASLIQLKSENNPVLFKASMNVAWSLVQDNDFLVATLFEDRELFPKIHGFCGSTFLSEFLGPPLHVELVPTTLSGYKYNVKIAVLIMDFIEELQAKPEFVMCDMKIESFGIVDNRMKYGDLANVFSNFYVDRLLSSSKPCSTDDDCSYKACKSSCDSVAKICSEKLLNNLLQIACEHIFNVILIWDRAPMALRSLIDRCINPILPADVDPAHRLGPSTELRNLIYNELANIYETLG